MPTQELKDNPAVNAIQLETWIPDVIPMLKARWTEHATGLLAGRPAPRVSDWLALLHAAAVTPSKIPQYLTQLLSAPTSSTDLQRNWATLLKLFTLTFEVVQEKGSQLDAQAWQNLLEIQNRVLKVATAATVARDGRPATDILSRRSLYWQTLTTFEKKFASIHSPNELLDTAVGLVQQNFNFDYVNFFTLNQAKQSLVLQNAAWKNGQPAIDGSISLEVRGAGSTSRAAATGQSILVNNTADDAQVLAHPALPKVKAQFSIPFVVGNNLLGVLDVGCDQPEAFAEDDRQMLPALAGYMATAVENARLQTLLQRRVHEQKLLYESNLALGASLDLDTVLNLMTQKTAETLQAGACAISQIDETAQTVTNLAEYVLRYPGNPAHIWRPLNSPSPLGQDPLAQQAIKTSRPVIEWADPGQPAIWQQPASPAEADARWGTVLALPLEAKKRIIGVMEIYDKNPNRSFSADDIQLCQILATQTAQAIERAQLFEETRQRLNEVATFYTLAQSITANLDLQSVLDSIVTSLRQAVGCRGCCIFLLDDNEEQLEIKAADGLKPQWREMAKLNIGEGAAGMAVAKKQAIYIPDTRQDPNFIFFDETVRSLLVIPLWSHGKIIGAINLDDTKPNTFGPAQERLLTIAAAQAGIAIENARLFAQVEAKQQQTQAIIQYMADGLLLIDHRGVIVTCNPALCMLLGMHSGEIVGQKVDSPNLHPNLASITATTTQRARTGVLAKEVTLNMPRPKILQIFSTRMIGDNRQPIGEVRVVHDVTRERELEQLKDEFMSTISHELRTPLFSIQGFVQILLENNEDLDPATHDEFLTIIQAQTMQLSEMVNNLLDASKLDEGRMKFDQKPVDILAVIHQTMLKLRGFAHQQKVELLPKLPAALPTILGDQVRLEQVLTNLVGNAIKFTPEGGRVIVSASTPKDSVLVEVKDNGVGIPREAQDRIFSRYYQVDDEEGSSRRGSGLGLYIAQKIVQGHGGRIWVESELAQGSTFRFTLPLPETPLD